MTSQTSTLTTKPVTTIFSAHRLAFAISTSLLSLSLIGCGGDGGSSATGGNADTNKDGGTPAQMSFSETATWSIDSTTPGTSCYDFDAQSEVSCDSAVWDLKFDNQARSVNLWSNSGVSGDGKGGVFGLMDWSALKKYTNATIDPDSGRDISSHYRMDKSAGVFKDKPWYEYNLQDRHLLYPNNRVYLVTTDNSDASTVSTVNRPVYALQVINYYNDVATSGFPTLRWINTALPTQVQTKTFDASSSDSWVYINLASGETTSKDGDWQVGLRRNNLILNSGDSGSGKVGGYVAKTPAGFCDESGAPITSKFITDNSASTLSDLTDTANYQVSADGVPWIVDQKSSNLNPGYSGNFPMLDYGWYTYNGNNHILTAKPIDTAKGALVRSAEGNSYARIRLDEIVYANPNVLAATKWVYKLDIQPAPKK
ncbi:HmuY family protein [Psychrobacter pygoscelis]|uniref:HmuY family protein n=1 Tax=Psychrobacter pygoscelis TaxID=2488563 RepID=UPI00103F0790|nr:HmuY family protein [Psychrobacter pygoscelis]